jgi:hypothetical protein
VPPEARDSSTAAPNCIAEHGWANNSDLRLARKGRRFGSAGNGSRAEVVMAADFVEPEDRPKDEPRGFIVTAARDFCLLAIFAIKLAENVILLCKWSGGNCVSLPMSLGRTTRVGKITSVFSQHD